MELKRKLYVLFAIIILIQGILLTYNSYAMYGKFSADISMIIGASLVVISWGYFLISANKLTRNNWSDLSILIITIINISFIVMYAMFGGINIMKFLQINKIPIAFFYASFALGMISSFMAKRTLTS